MVKTDNLLGRFVYSTAIALLILLLGVVRAVLAQETETFPGTPSAEAPTVAYQCVQGTIVDEDKQLVRLHATGLPTDRDVVLIGCVQADDWHCTSGDNALDAQIPLLFGANNYTKLSTRTTSPFPYFFELEGGAKRRLTDGTLDITVRSASKDVTNHTFYVVYPLSEAAVVHDGSASTLQYGTIRFSGTDAADSCISIRQDPYGMVFDAQSLEPLPDATVMLLDDTDVKFSLLGVPNPIITLANGLFNFLVPEGAYKLAVSKGGYTLTNSPHPNYTRAYSQLYQPDEIIYEAQGIPEHRDVAMDPGANAPYRADPSIITYGIVNMGSQTRLQGQTSHPLTVVTAKQGETQLAQVSADNFGFFTMTLQNSMMTQDLSIDVYLQKVDLIGGDQVQEPQSFLIKTIYAQESPAPLPAALSVDPIPRYLEGYAYDLTGMLIPFATVEVRLGMSNEIYYTTQADENGFFTIPASQTPIFNYYLSFSKPNQLEEGAKQTPVEFAAFNRDYLTQNNINLVAGTKNGVPVVQNRGEQMAQVVPTAAAEQQMQPTIAPPAAAEVQAGRPNTLLMVILIIAVVIALAIVVEFIKVKRARFDYTPVGHYENEPTPSMTPPPSPNAQPIAPSAPPAVPDFPHASTDEAAPPPPAAPSAPTEEDWK